MTKSLAVLFLAVLLTACATRKAPNRPPPGAVTPDGIGTSPSTPNP